MRYCALSGIVHSSQTSLSSLLLSVPLFSPLPLSSSFTHSHPSPSPSPCLPLSLSLSISLSLLPYASPLLPSLISLSLSFYLLPAPCPHTHAHPAYPNQSICGVVKFWFVLSGIPIQYSHSQWHHSFLSVMYVRKSIC